MNSEELLRLRLQNQLLAEPAALDATGVVRHFGALQAQDFAGARWAVVQRSAGFDRAGFDDAFARGAILRTHVLRPTWHLAPAEDLRWMLELTAKRIEAKSAYYRRGLGITDALLARSERVLRRELRARGELTRAEVSEALSGAGIDTEGGRLAFYTMHAELHALVCSGAPRRGQQTFALLDARAPAVPSPARDAARAELARRYFRSRGPATLRDFAWWSGFTLREARTALTALGSEMHGEELDGVIYWYFPAQHSDRREAVVRLLPNYDEYVVAYADRSALFDAAHTAKLDTRGNPLFQHVVVANGRVVGSWKRPPKARGEPPEVTLFERLGRAERTALREAVERFGA